MRNYLILTLTLGALSAFSSLDDEGSTRPLVRQPLSDSRNDDTQALERRLNEERLKFREIKLRTDEQRDKLLLRREEDQLAHEREKRRIELEQKRSQLKLNTQLSRAERIAQLRQLESEISAFTVESQARINAHYLDNQDKYLDLLERGRDRGVLGGLMDYCEDNCPSIYDRASICLSFFKDWGIRILQIPLKTFILVFLSERK